MSCKRPSWTSHLACSRMGRGWHSLLEYNLKRKVFSEYREVRWTGQMLHFILFYPHRSDFSSLLLWYLQHISIYKESKVWGNRIWLQNMKCHSVHFILSRRKSIRMEAVQGQHRDHFPSVSLAFSTFKSLQFSIVNRCHIQVNLSSACCL